MKKSTLCLCNDPIQKGNQMNLEYAISVLVRERNKIVKEIYKLESEKKKLHKQKLQYTNELFGDNDVTSLLESIDSTVSKTIPENIRFLNLDLKSLNDALLYLCQSVKDNDSKE